ncbi:hypothetical protein CBS147343_4632 [Aspergillus niger]|nr:hypothetical protein CBS12448_3887 [Aspergillus niger]KAI2915439.1 hypothetical protein CBS147371_5724 [Aspergillus niger]KAI2933612.1 hypothetical protein CBS147320_1468 [Aspergillus niger]KAI2951050.1 hypothetical protein CBS147321_1319 [Aspergillus niger]KAI2953856.1 hypothetical protein CBS147322_4019 [Aspergillus niger]
MTYDDKPSAAANLPPVLALPAEGSERPAVIIPSTKNAPSTVVSYKDLNESVTRVQSTLAQFGVGEGTRVALVLPNGLEFVGSFLAVICQRATAAPLNPQYKREELKDILRLMRPSLLISMKSTHLISASVLAAQDLAIPVAICRTEGPNIYIEGEHSSSGAESHVPIHSPYDLRPSDKAVLLFTSGTTGAPKSVALSHENLLVAMRIIIDAHKLSPADRCMIITPLFHIIGVGGSLLTSLFSGGCVIIPPALPVPTLYRLLISFPRPDVMPKLRFIRSGGSDLSPELYQRLHELGTQVIEVYGMTETAPAIFCNRLDSSMRRLAHYPIASTVEVMILPSEGRAGNHPDAGRLTNEPGIVGEICVRGKSIMTGYLDNPKANEQAFLFGGFFRTGDLGVIKEHGYLQLTGRVKEIINKGGEKISPSEIEHVASSFEGVRESLCFRIPDEIYGEEVGVAAVIEVGKQVTEAALKKHFRQHVAMFKVPKAVFFVDTIPTNRTGKPLRSLLSEQYVQGLFAIRPQK